ncbi:MAG: hypothetical protein AB7E29_03120 [Xanthobacter sp.]
MSWYKSFLFVCMIAVPAGLILMTIIGIAFQQESFIWQGDLSLLTRYLR